MKTIIISALAIGIALGSAATVSAVPEPFPGKGQPKVDVCHWDEEEEAYVLISVGAPAGERHLANHDLDVAPFEDSDGALLCPGDEGFPEVAPEEA